MNTVWAIGEACKNSEAYLIGHIFRTQTEAKRFYNKFPKAEWGNRRVIEWPLANEKEETWS